MKHMQKYTALFLALLLCLTALWGCGSKEPQDAETPDDSQQEQQGDQTQQDNGDQTDDEDLQDVPELLSATIVCSDGETTLRFEKNEKDQWQWKDDPTFPLDTAYVDALAASIRQILAAQPVVTDKTPEELDLDSDEKYLSVTDEKGFQITWYLGKTDENGCYYLCVEGDESGTVWLAPAELTEQVSRSIYDMMLLPQFPAIPAERMHSITVTAGEKTVNTFPNSDGKWVVGISSVHEEVQPLLQALGNLQIITCVDYAPSEGAAEICGFNANSTRVELAYTTLNGADSTLVLTVGNKLTRGYCVTLGEEDTIYLMDAALIDPILAFIA